MSKNDNGTKTLSQKCQTMTYVTGINVDATFEDIKSFLLPKGGKKIKLIHRTENNEKRFSGAIMIDFDTIEEKLTFDQQDLCFNDKELAKITNVLSLRSNPQEELNPGLHLIRITSNKKLRRHQVRKLIGEKGQRMIRTDKKSPKPKRVKEGMIFFADVRENETIVQLLRPMKAVDRIEYLRNEKLIDQDGKLLENEDIVLSKLAKTAEITISAINDPCEAAKIFDRTEKRREDIRERIILIKGIVTKKAETRQARQKMAAEVSADLASAIGYHSEFVNFIHLDRNQKGLKGTGRIFLQEMASSESVIAEMDDNPVKLSSCSKPVTFEILKPGSLTQLDGCVKEITQVQNLTEVGYTHKDGADRKTSSEGEGNKQTSNNNEEESMPTVLVQIDNIKNGDSNRLDSGRGGRKVITGSKRTTSHIVWESDYVITSEWRLENVCKKSKLNGEANEVSGNAIEDQNCIPKRVSKGVKKTSKEAKKAKEELSESKLDTDLENYFIASKKKKVEDNKMEVEESAIDDVKEDVSLNKKNSESDSTVTEKMEIDESEKEQPVETKVEEEDPLTEEDEQTLLDEGLEKTNDEKTEEMQDSNKSDLVEEVQDEKTPNEQSSEENIPTASVQEENTTKEATENTPEENSKEAPEETSVETSADSLPPLEDADNEGDQKDDEDIPWQRIVKVSIPEEAIGKTQIRQQDLINKIGKKNYDGKVYYEKGQTEAYLLVTESAKETVAAMTENPVKIRKASSVMFSALSESDVELAKTAYAKLN